MPESARSPKPATATVADAASEPPENVGTAERILEAASGLLVSGGYEALSMRRVGAMIGLSQAAIYRHYADKADLVSAVVERGYGLLRDSVEGLDDGVTSPAALLAIGVRSYVEFAEKNSSLFKAVLLQGIGPSQERVNALSPGVARQRKTFQILAGLIARGTATGVFAACDPELTAQAVWASMFGLAVRMVLENGGGSGSERRRLIIDRQIDIMLRGLRGAEEKQ
jgi:AcrR family transcriptional regulator